LLSLNSRRFFGIYPDLLFEAPVACDPRPTSGMCRFCGLINLFAAIENLFRKPVMSLARRQEIQAVVTVFGVIPVNESKHPFPGLRSITQSVCRVFRAVLARAKYGFRVEAVIADTWPASGGRNTQAVQRFQQRRPLHGTAVIRMQHQWLLANDALFPDDSSAN
jgi:hypothetical protein